MCRTCSKESGFSLRDFKKTVNGLSVKGKLTNAMIDRLQKYYGIVIRQNKNDLRKMKEAVMAT